MQLFRWVSRRYYFPDFVRLKLIKIKNKMKIFFNSFVSYMRLELAYKLEQSAVFCFYSKLTAKEKELFFSGLIIMNSFDQNSYQWMSFSCKSISQFLILSCNNEFSIIFFLSVIFSWKILLFFSDYLKQKQKIVKWHKSQIHTNSSENTQYFG